MKTGLVLGKFAPLHKGHQLLIETALEENDHVIVLIYHAPDATSVPLPVRSQWIRDLYPTVQLIEAWDGPAGRSRGPRQSGGGGQSPAGGLAGSDREGTADADRPRDAGGVGCHAARIPGCPERGGVGRRGRTGHAGARGARDRGDEAMSHARTLRLAFWFLLPASLVLAAVIAYPFAYNLYISLTNWNIATDGSCRLRPRKQNQ